ncbi:glucose/quinate/shikimate family membrane-bound PQQ-dependent dehydrogenase [Rubellimicrobium arenae]|uniref:glucose/quinate/shikimate family membrane-bound PQQ-dependent dehydrogenase n=1 Tax=Rubellimicrobium arenae TaxID=2817372 RepID=UPI001FEE3079|nr:glucose/quinate/shikimate family membrane-bound PQQ-dependent dehydrogenase [Rubellimicrobium arenae]
MARALAVIFLLIGVGLFVAGGWLISLGGSPYYAIAGVGITLTGFLLFRGSPAALWLYALVVLGTLAWAVAEIGLDWWALVPRGDVIFVLGVLLLLPWVTRGLGGSASARRGGGLALAGSLVVAAVVGIAAMIGDEHTRPGELATARADVPTNYGGVPDDDWWAYGRSLRGERWSPLDQITPENVQQLDVAWTYRTGDIAGPDDPAETTYEVTPLKVGNTVYLCTPHNWVIALDAETGEERWRYDPEIEVRENLQHLTCRGVGYHDATQPGAAAAPGGECPQRILVSTNDSRLMALDAATGQPCPGFGEGGAVHLDQESPEFRPGWYQFTSAPLVTRQLIILGGAVYDNAAVTMPSGVIRAFDVNTGALVWNFDPGRPDDTTPLAPGEHYVPSTPNSWGTSTADEDLGLVYVPMGMGAVDQWGGNRPETTERFATSILALDLATGAPRWTYQAVHHDLWDMDLGAQPTLVDLDMPQGRVPALVQPTKTGDLFILDRRTGEPVHPAPERPVPQGAAEGDWTSETQPFSTVTLRPGLVREKDMWGSTLFDQLACRIQFRQMRYEGDYTPPSVQGTLVYPGNFGVFDWGGVAVDPVRQIAFTNPDYMAFVDRLVPRENPASDAQVDNPQNQPTGGSDIQGSHSEDGLNPNEGAPFAVALNAFLSPIGLPCQEPPWGYVAGVDLVSGDVAYMRRNGTIRDNTPLPLPFKMGVPALGGPITTQGGVAFLTSTLDQFIRGYDVTTGEELWQARLPAGGQSTPMTYRSADSGRQFVVTVVGGHGSLGTNLGDYVIAYALPEEG